VIEIGLIKQVGNGDDSDFEEGAVVKKPKGKGKATDEEESEEPLELDEIRDVLPSTKMKKLG
jgi:hypothetical protein